MSRFPIESLSTQSGDPSARFGAPPTKPGSLHLTEQDVQTYFEANPPIPRTKRTQQRARQIRKEYLANPGWWKSLILGSFPIIEEIRTYKKEYVIPDLAAGVAAGISAIPIGMSYAILARFPPVYGLYCQLFYCIIYMFLGTGKQLCVGTSAVEAMMAAEAIAGIIGWDAPDEAWLNASVGLSFFVGLNLIVMRFLGLGVIANFLADPVVSGFSTGCAIMIASSQLKHFFGIEVPRLNTLQTWWYLITNIHMTRWASVVIGTIGILLLALSNYVNKKWMNKFPLPGSLFVMVIFILLGYLLRIDEAPFDVQIIGIILGGFPSPQLFDFDGSLVLPIFKASLLYSVVYFFIHTSIARSVAQKKGFTINNNQELLAVGTCSFVGSFFQCYPIATSVARTSIACIAGAMTSLYNVMNFATIALTITVLTPLLRYLPKAALSSVVLFGVYFMMYFSEGWRLLKLFSLDFILWVVCLVSTVVFGAMQGIIISVCLSLVWIIKDSSFPSTGVLGRLPGTKVFRSVNSFAEAEEIPQKKIIQLVKLDKESLERKEHRSLTLDGSNLDVKMVNTIRVIIIDASSITRIDVTAIRMLESVACKLHDHGKVMLFANWKGPMRTFLEKANFYDTVPLDHCFPNLHGAVHWAESFFLRRDSSSHTSRLTDITSVAQIDDLPRARRQTNREDPLHTLQL